MEYKNQLDSNNDIKSVSVYLEKKSVGVIKKVKGGWAYFPRGHEHGDVFDSISAVKKSLDTDQYYV